MRDQFSSTFAALQAHFSSQDPNEALPTTTLGSARNSLSLADRSSSRDVPMKEAPNSAGTTVDPMSGPPHQWQIERPPVEEVSNPPRSITDSLLERQLDLRDELGINPLEGIRGRGSAKRWTAKDHEDSRQRGRAGRGGVRGRGVKRGPRKAAEPTGDIKQRLERATNAYMDGRLDEAIALVEDAIRINAEIYRSWALLASLHQEKGDIKKSFDIRFWACTLEPKNVEGWIKCAENGDQLREEHPDDADDYLERAVHCYSQALRADVENRPARHGRAALYFEKGFIGNAAKDYHYLLERNPIDVFALRGLAEMNGLLAGTGKRQFADRLQMTLDCYRRAIDQLRSEGMDPRYPFEWEDISIFVGLLAWTGQTKDALHEVKSLSRWLLGRGEEAFWDDYQDDDREWDLDHVRRREVDEFQENQYPISSYGDGLPLDPRTKLAVYRLKLEDMHEAMHHIAMLEPEGPNANKLLSEEPHLLAEAAMALYESGLFPAALRFFEPLFNIPDILDSSSLLAAGRCYLDAGDKRQAEECFSAAIDADEPNDPASIDARYELAKMYEAAREEREAFILVNEAIKLQNAQYEYRREDDEEDDETNEDHEGHVNEGQEGGEAEIHGDTEAMGLNANRPKKLRELKPKPPKPPKAPKPVKPKPAPKPKKDAPPKAPRRRPRVFARSDELEAEERRRSEHLARAWQEVRESREERGDGDGKPSQGFMRSAKELVDDFRSCKNFYSWDKYLTHLGIDLDRGTIMSASRGRNLIEMKERLSQNLNPNSSVEEKRVLERKAVSYRGVPFDEWLGLFMEFALGLAQSDRFSEAYKVCESARDAEVFSKNKEDLFFVHVTWASCALRARDEEMCVAAARAIMRENQFDTDPFRMFAALSRLCPSPASWYASGPVQKYLLRQIKLMDRSLMRTDGADDSGGDDEEGAVAPGTFRKTYPAKELDVTLLMLYGHILFVSNSFTNALNYFFRAYSADPANQMILLSIGQCYIHYALKRQSENRQYHLVQGFSYLHEYYALRTASPRAAARQEAHYNMGRSYHAVGLVHLAIEFYQKALQDRPTDDEGDGGDGRGTGGGVMGRDDLAQEAAFNLQQICWAGGDLESVRALAEEYLTL
ncbi:hypothetical protein GGR56DRAFT_626811 [Xylariaceae sp. FL0804]|nr:hypothetical protein GGR56DRAFT_626811 [Xylariaceae sp. FL0804]